MADECLICGAPLEYLPTETAMECAICKKHFLSRSRCQKGHYVCDECHTAGLSTILDVCLKTDSTNPVEILEDLMSLPFCHMHGPEHHTMVGAALLTAAKNAGADLDLSVALPEMIRRGKTVPGGVCGAWGACGAGISSGMFWSILMGTTPLTEKSWSDGNLLTSRSLIAISRHGGPRCCKRDSYLSVLEGARFALEKLGLVMTPRNPVCTRHAQNRQCLGSKCPFFPKEG